MMQIFYILCGVILLSGCTALGSENVKASKVSKSTGYVPYNSVNHSNTNNPYKTSNETRIINGSKSVYPANKKIKPVRQVNYDAAIDNLSKLPEFILIHI